MLNAEEVTEEIGINSCAHEFAFDAAFAEFIAA